MSTSTILLRARVDAGNEAMASRILAALGIDKTSAINMYLAKIVATGGIPFETRLGGADYAAIEYGATPAQVARATTRARREIQTLRKQGKLIDVT